MQEVLPCDLQFLLQTRRAVAVAACTRLSPILIAAVAAVVGILHSSQVEVLFPVGLLFLQGRRTITDFYPARGLVRAEPCILHISKILAFGDRSAAQRLLLDGLEKICFTAWFYAGSNQITHRLSLCLYCKPACASIPRN